MDLIGYLLTAIATSGIVSGACSYVLKLWFDKRLKQYEMELKEKAERQQKNYDRFSEVSEMIEQTQDIIARRFSNTCDIENAREYIGLLRQRDKDINDWIMKNRFHVQMT